MTVTLGNIRETHRFSHSAWRLAALIPTKLKNGSSIPSNVKKLLWHEVMSLVFENYDSIQEKGLLVECADGKVRDLAAVLSMWQGDQPEIDTLLNLIAVGQLKLHVICLY